MASASAKDKKHRHKPPKSRPAATSAISQSIVADTPLPLISAFSPDGTLFALVSLAVDKHRLRVYQTGSGQAVADFTPKVARVSSLCWANYDLSRTPQSTAHESSEGTPAKKRKTVRSSVPPADLGRASNRDQVVILGLSNGSIVVFSPSAGNVARTFSSPESATPISAVELHGDLVPVIWTCSKDGAVRQWNASTGELISSWKMDDRTPYSSVATRPGILTQSVGHTHVLVGSHTIRMFSVSGTSSDEDDGVDQKPIEICSFAGHASPITALRWDCSTASTTSPAVTRFLSMANGDRIAYVWDLPDIQPVASKEGRMAAFVALDSDVRQLDFAIRPEEFTPQAGIQTLLALSTAGTLSIYSLPKEISASGQSGKSKPKVPSLTAMSTVSISQLGKPAATADKIVAASFMPGNDGRLQIAQLVNGIRPVFHTARYLDDSGNFIPEVSITPTRTPSAGTSSQGLTKTQRYGETPTTAVSAGLELGHGSEDDGNGKGTYGNLDVDLAELSLGQRLAGMSEIDAIMDDVSASDDDDQQAGDGSTPKRRHPRQATETVVPNSLSRTLIQALHSSDARLLESCLQHSDQTLIQNTVRRLPPQLAVPLLSACVERLGRGHRGASGKGGGGGASSQRGMALVSWVKAVLVVHSAHLMTMPDVVARLAALHGTLTSRLALQNRLLSLSGRLDLVLSQIELRSSAVPAPLVPKKKGSEAKQQPTSARYVEGQSSDEEEAEAAEIESQDEGGSVEEVELGGQSDEDESDDGEFEAESDEDESEVEETEESSEEDLSGAGGPRLNGFVEDDAEDWSDEDAEGSDEE